MDVKRAAALALALAGCGPTVVHRPDAAHPGFSTVRGAENELDRHVVAGDGIEIHATLWDASLVAAAAAEDDAPYAWHPDWAAVYLARTSFTVVAEVEDRWPELPADALLRAEHWWFQLDRAGDEDIAPLDVELLVADRFPTPAGRHHHRLVFAVHFDGSLHASLPRGPSHLRLRVGCKLPQTGRRSMTGQAIRSRGATLHWRVEPA